ncbi:hypothetical protein LTS17_012862 [Exophiala oligosperma]
MASNMKFHKPEYGVRASDNAEPVDQGDGESVAKTVTGPTSPGQADPESRNEIDKDNGMDPGVTLSECVATRVEDDHQKSELTGSTPMGKVITARDWANSEDHTPAKSPKHRKIYVHHRHTRGLTKMFTAGSASLHLPFLHRHSHGKEKEAEDPEGKDGMPQKRVTVLHNFWIMLTTFPYWNMAFWSGWCYSIGSALFIVSSCISWVPLAYPNIDEGHTLETYGSPLTFFFGACLYQIGGVMAYLEAINDGCFAGAAMKRLLEGHQDIERELLDAKLHTFFGHLIPHHHHEDDDDESNGNSVNAAANNWESITNSNSRPEDLYDEAKERVERRQGVDHGSASAQHQSGEVREYLVWRWWPNWNSFIHYHIRELGYVACAVQLFGVTLYGITSVVILPGIYDSLSQWQLVAAYWVPQTVASCCFIIASIMFTIMAQDRWNKPKWGAVSWWIGIYALIGSVGFL